VVFSTRLGHGQGTLSLGALTSKCPQLSLVDPPDQRNET
jgi:hypothetical protein